MEDEDFEEENSNPDGKNLKRKKIVAAKPRGPTQMRGIWGRREGEDLLKVSFNSYGQPIGEIATQLSHFINSLVRDGKYALLTFPNWHKVPQETKENLWKILKSKFDLPDSSKAWVMHKSGAQLGTWRKRVKAKYYTKYMPLEEQKKLKGTCVHDEHYESLFNCWSTKKDQDRSTENKKSRAKHLHNHTTGSKSMAREIILQRPPTRAEIFRVCYRKKDGSYSDDVILSKFKCDK